MARSYAKLYVTVWGSDFRTLTRGAQHLYFQLMSNPKLSSAGCVAIQARKWAAQSSDSTPADVERALDELAQHRYILVDDDTEELLIRSFIRHDRGHRNQFLRKSIETAITTIESPRLREHARLELAAAIEDAASPQVEDSWQDSYEDPSDDSDEVPLEDTNDDAWQANYSPHPHLQTSTPPPPPAQVGDDTDPPPSEPDGGDGISRINNIADDYVRLTIAGMEQRGETIKAPAGLKRHLHAKALDHPDLERWADLFPTAPPDAIAAWLLGDKGSMRYFPLKGELATELHGRSSA
jgi:hypothetical protein